jgi:hypothetical protein
MTRLDIDLSKKPEEVTIATDSWELTLGPRANLQTWKGVSFKHVPSRELLRGTARKLALEAFASLGFKSKVFQQAHFELLLVAAYRTKRMSGFMIGEKEIGELPSFTKGEAVRKRLNRWFDWTAADRLFQCVTSDHEMTLRLLLPGSSISFKPTVEAAQKFCDVLFPSLDPGVGLYIPPPAKNQDAPMYLHGEPAKDSSSSTAVLSFHFVDVSAPTNATTAPDAASAVAADLPQPHQPIPVAEPQSIAGPRESVLLPPSETGNLPSQSAAHSNPSAASVAPIQDKTRHPVTRPRVLAVLSLVLALACLVLLAAKHGWPNRGQSSTSGQPRNLPLSGVSGGSRGDFDIYQKNSPLTSMEGIRLRWNDAMPVREILTSYPHAAADLTDSGRSWTRVFNVLYEGTEISRGFLLIFQDGNGKSGSEYLVLQRDVWTPVATDLRHLYETGTDVHAIASITIRVTNITHGEKGSIIAVGLADTSIAPTSLVVPRAPPRTEPSPPVMTLKAAIGVVPNLKTFAEMSEKMCLAVFRDGVDADFVYSIERYLPPHPTFPIDITLSSGRTGSSIEGPVRIVAVLYVGNQSIEGVFRGVLTKSPVPIVLTRRLSKQDASISWEELRPFDGKDSTESVMRDFDPVLSDKQCNSGDRIACFSLGMHCYDGVSVPRDPVRAGRLWLRSCELGMATSCRNLGVLYANGTGVPKDIARATALFKKNCDEGDAGSCRDLGTVYREYLSGQDNDKKALQLYERGCSGKDAGSCLRLGLMYADGSGVQENKEVASELMRKACDASESNACRALGDLYWFDKGGLADPRAAGIYYGRGCSGGDAKACSALAQLYEFGKGVERDFQRAEQLNLLGCDGQVGIACNNLGVTYEEGRFGIEQDLVKALAFISRACDLKYPLGCANQARLMLQTPGADLAQAQVSAGKACRQKNSMGCYILGEIIFKGLHGNDRRQAEKLFAEACKLGQAAACVRAESLKQGVSTSVGSVHPGFL